MKTGIGLRAPHKQDFLEKAYDVGFLEVHSENYFGGGKPRKQLKQLRQHYPISLHGVGLSLGDASGLEEQHLTELKSLVDDIDPLFVSEHLSWSSYNHRHVPDLLPIPFIDESLNIFIKHIQQFQKFIGREILIENPSNYIAFKETKYSEPEFLNILTDKTGCGLLLDINNIAVSAHNLGYDANAYIDTIQKIDQIHLAGYQVNKLANGEEIYLDTHGKTVHDSVWLLYQYTIEKFGTVPTLIEWDTDIPDIDILLKEAAKADAILANHNRSFQKVTHAS